MEICLLLALYVAAFALQVGGVVLVVLDIRDDRRAATRLADAREQQKGLTGVRSSPAPGVSVEVRGLAGAALAQVTAASDTFAEFIHERMMGRQSRKLLGVALILIGASLALAANLVATI